MTPWGEKPGGFSGTGSFSGDNAWLGNAKRQSLFRGTSPMVSWATSQPGTAKIQQQPAQPAQPNLIQQQPAQPPSVQQPQPAQPAAIQQQPARPASLFSPPPRAAGTDIWGRTPDQIRTEYENEKRVLWEMDQVRKQQGLPLNRAGYNPNVHGEDHPWNPAFKGFS